jgi:hypothetical protein
MNPFGKNKKVMAFIRSMHHTFNLGASTVLPVVKLTVLSTNFLVYLGGKCV